MDLTVSEKNSLLPCPFCGENEQEFVAFIEYTSEGPVDSEECAVRCQYCGAMGERCGASKKWGKRHAMKCWNTRIKKEEE